MCRSQIDERLELDGENRLHYRRLLEVGKIGGHEFLWMRTGWSLAKDTSECMVGEGRSRSSASAGHDEAVGRGREG